MSAISRSRTMLVEGPCAPSKERSLVASTLPAPGAALVPLLELPVVTLSVDRLLDVPLAAWLGKRMPVAPPVLVAPPLLVPPPLLVAPPLLVTPPVDELPVDELLFD